MTRNGIAGQWNLNISMVDEKSTVHSEVLDRLQWTFFGRYRVPQQGPPSPLWKNSYEEDLEKAPQFCNILLQAYEDGLKSIC